MTIELSFCEFYCIVEGGSSLLDVSFYHMKNADMKCNGNIISLLEHSQLQESHDYTWEFDNKPSLID